jgi:pantoate--beta-alanine ligase
MQLVSTVAEIQRLARTWQRQGLRVGLVPTMGYLHEGHLSLARRARTLVGPRGVVVVSIYVNPAQFGPKEDFSRYPRNPGRDARLCRDAQTVDLVFCPSDKQMYPENRTGPMSTFVVEEGLSQAMEGASRPAHFRGVTTVVAKLFNLVQPTHAVFGAKDFQQAAIIKRMVHDLNFPIVIDVGPTLREADGLAMSSRNRYLEGDLRQQALVLWRSLRKAQEAVRGSVRALPAARLRAELKAFIEGEPAARVDYIEFFDPDTLQSLTRVSKGTHLALAVWIGQTRLIDNAALG